MATRADGEAATEAMLDLAKDTGPLHRMAGLGLTDDELAAYFGVDKATLVERFSAVLIKGRADLAVRVRSAILSRAENGDVVALGWLREQVRVLTEKTG